MVPGIKRIFHGTDTYSTICPFKGKRGLSFIQGKRPNAEDIYSKFLSKNTFIPQQW